MSDLRFEVLQGDSSALEEACDLGLFSNLTGRQTAVWSWSAGHVPVSHFHR